jgi:hypothetical protein
MEKESNFILPQLINYNLISDAINWYQNNGFEYIEVPWKVSKEAMSVTFPNSKKGLVGSAEQSFIQMMLDGKLKNGKYVACTPCFRNEVVDEYHYPYFMKVELIDFGSSSYNQNLLLSKKFFESRLHVKSEIKFKELKTKDGFDLLMSFDSKNELEVGSYGVRKYKDFIWSYGTGIAEPRFSKHLLNLNCGFKYINIYKGYRIENKLSCDNIKKGILNEIIHLKNLNYNYTHEYFSNKKERHSISIPASLDFDEVCAEIDTIVSLKDII